MGETLDITATCDRIRSLAADLDIDLRVIEQALPSDQVLVEVHQDDVDAFQDATAAGPQEEFGCNWPSSEWAGLRALLPWAGLPPWSEYVTRTVPRADLETLKVCFEAKTRQVKDDDGRRPRRRWWVFMALFAFFVVAAVLAVREAQYVVAGILAFAAYLASNSAAAAEYDLWVAKRLRARAVPA